MTLLGPQEVEAVAITIVAVAGFTAAFKLLSPLVRALARRLEGTATASADLEELRARIAQLEGEQLRWQELEERLDFTERVVSRSSEQARLGSGGPA